MELIHGYCHSELLMEISTSWCLFNVLTTCCFAQQNVHENCLGLHKKSRPLVYLGMVYIDWHWCFLRAQLDAWLTIMLNIEWVAIEGSRILLMELRCWMAYSSTSSFERGWFQQLQGGIWMIKQRYKQNIMITWENQIEIYVVFDIYHYTSRSTEVICGNIYISMHLKRQQIFYFCPCDIINVPKKLNFYIKSRETGTRAF